MKRFVFLVCMVGAFKMHAYDASPQCYKDLQRDFFSYDLVIQALSMYPIPQGQWENIYKDLQYASQYVPQMIKERASYMQPNPIENRFYPKEAQELLFDVLFEVFTNVMRINAHEDYRSPLIDQKNVRDMFGFIRGRQVLRLNKCLGFQVDS